MKPVQQQVGLGEHDSVGLLLMHWLPHCLTLPAGVADLVLDLGLELSRPLVPGNFNIHAENLGDELAQDFLATMTNLCLSQVISGPMHQSMCTHTLDLMLCSD